MSRLYYLTSLLITILLIVIPTSASKINQKQQFSDDLVIILGLTYVYFKQIEKKRKPKEVWVNSYLKDRKSKGRYYKDVSKIINSMLYLNLIC